VCLLLFDLGRPVHILNARIEIPQLVGEFACLATHGADINRRDISQFGSRVAILGLRGVGKIRPHAVTLTKDIPPGERHGHGKTGLNLGHQILNVDADDQSLEFLRHAVVLSEKGACIFGGYVSLLKTGMLDGSACDMCEPRLQIGTLSKHFCDFHRSSFHDLRKILPFIAMYPV